MADLTKGSVLRPLESLFDGGSVAGLTDRQLLERFIARRDASAEVAFTALVSRHGPMVRGICRQILCDRHHAEDAFQAVFLVLACKARSIRNPDLLGSWLYGVTLRTAQKAKGRLSRQRKDEAGDALRGPGALTMIEAMIPPADGVAMASEQAEILHGEVDRLPKPFRLPVVLCYFEGLTLDQAAQRLRLPAGTLRSRLARARDKLRRGLDRRGVTSPSAAPAAALIPRFSREIVPSCPPCERTTEAAMSFAAGQGAGLVASTSAAALAKEVLRSMMLHDTKVIALTLLLLGAIATGAGLLSRSPAIEGEPNEPPVGQPLLAAEPHGPLRGPAAGRMFVSGRVLDPQGKPLSNASMMVYARSKEPGRGDSFQQMSTAPLGQASCDDSGRFRVDTPRTSSARNDLFGAVALAPGHGVGWVELDPDAEQPTADIILRPEQVIQGRLLDLQGQPARDVKVTVSSIHRIIDGKIADPHFSWAHAIDSLAWPRSATSDDDGRFTVRGVGRNLRAVLIADATRFARLTIPVETDEASQSKQVTASMEPAKVITGRVTYADTGKPVPHAPVHILAYQGNGGHYSNELETDTEGRYRANPLSADRYGVSVYPPEGQPYLNVERGLNWTAGALESSIDVILPRGAVIHGKVTESGSGKPVSGARVNYSSRPPKDDKSGAWNSPSGTAPDGSFRFAVLPGPGYLIVQAPSDEYVLREMGKRMVQQGQPGGSRLYANAFVHGDMKPGSAGLEVNVELHRGVSVKGLVAGPDGTVVPDALMISRVILEPYRGAYRSWRAGYQGAVRNGRFELHGLSTDLEVPVFFLEPKSKLGATVNLSGKSAAGGPITVRIEPCGLAKARLVDPGGRPVEGYRESSLIVMVVTSGPAVPGRQEENDRLDAHQGRLADIDPINYGNGPASDVQGRIAFPALIPGATYRIFDRTTSRDETGPQVRKEFTVKRGEQVDLGDILIEKAKGGR